jgi:hypothetical protein
MRSDIAACIARELLSRESIESARPSARPRVRCRIDGDSLAHTASITIDGNNPWIEFTYLGVHFCERFSWGLVLEVLNDRFAPPLDFRNINYRTGEQAIDWAEIAEQRRSL